MRGPSRSAGSGHLAAFIWGHCRVGRPLVAQPYRRRSLPGRHGDPPGPGESAQPRAGSVQTARKCRPRGRQDGPNRGRTGERVSGLESPDRFATANSVKRATSTVRW
ncbi:hypothetical protein HPB47_012373 [Ixodes persulcatus]|uniref:Uncharacterized protein n=1 Tax=Ixodes persulcatus TaxID=34615 RepID=A0AC60NTR9_IXOPE|nr:hypothetical protein HPB47_012373 [Ixodes persulcatus]